MDNQEFAQLLNELYADNWHDYINPSDLQAVIDCAKEFGCEKCGHHHIHAHGLVKGRPQHHYRCFAVCDDCGFVNEF